VDEALSFGWIDGLRKRLDDERYVIRFTPRKTGSHWSLVNIKRARALIRSKRMQPAGLRAFESRDEKKSGRYSFEQRAQPKLDPDSEARFRKHAAAWRFFEAQPPGYRRIVTFWIVSARKDDTRTRRLDKAIEESAAARRIDFMQPIARRSGGTSGRSDTSV
jgi:uncharacterized protein YdeI (YjbR/CyaY-like superfamily)